MMDSLNYLSFYNRRSKICVVYYPVCGIMYIKDPLLLIGKSSPRRGGSGVFSLAVGMVLYHKCLKK